MPFGRKQDENPETTDDTSTAMAEAEEIITADVQTLRPSQRAVLSLLTELENIATEDTESKGFSGDDIAGILMAENEAVMWEADELPRINAKVLSGSEIEIYGWEVKFSDDPEIVTGLIGPSTRRKMYLLVRSTRLNDAGQSSVYKLPDVGEEFVWNTSARFIVAKLYWLLKHGNFDDKRTVKARIVGTDLGAGKSVEKLKPLSTITMSAGEAPF
jgi:hypothetical protein